MKEIIYFVLIFLFSGCTAFNKVIETRDEFKNTRNLKLDMLVTGKTDQPLNQTASRLTYLSQINWVAIEFEEQEPVVYLNLGVETSAINEKLLPEIFLQAGPDIIKLNATLSRQENFGRQQTETTVSTEIVKEKEKNDGTEKKNEKAETTEKVVSTAVTSSSSEQLRYTQHKYLIDKELVATILDSKSLTIRYYMGDVGVSAKLKPKEMKALNIFLTTLQTF